MLLAIQQPKLAPTQATPCVLVFYQVRSTHQAGFPQFFLTYSKLGTKRTRGALLALGLRTAGNQPRARRPEVATPLASRQVLKNRRGAERRR